MEHDYWAHAAGITFTEAALIAESFGFGMERGRFSRFENARNSVVIAEADLRDGLVNRVTLAEEIQHGLDRDTHEAGRAKRRGLSVAEFHVEVFQRILENVVSGRFTFLTNEDVSAIQGWIKALSEVPDEN
jgi:hypothetical protein